MDLTYSKNQYKMRKQYKLWSFNMKLVEDDKLKAIMNEKEIMYFKRCGLKTVIATNPKTGSAIVFNQSEQKWIVAPQNYHQIIYDDYFEKISKKEAQNIFQDIPPDDKLDELDGFFIGIRERMNENDRRTI
jgi:hypothetical protein